MVKDENNIWYGWDPVNIDGEDFELGKNERYYPIPTDETAELYHKYNYKPFFDAGVLRNSLANEVYEGYKNFEGDNPYEFAMYMLGISQEDSEVAEEKFINPRYLSSIRYLYQK